MNSNKSFYARAEDEIKHRREVNSQKIEARKREVESRIPEYKALSGEIAKTGQLLCALILAGDSRRIEKLQKDNLSAQEMMRSLLIQHKYEADYLAEIYTCKKCRDSGVYQDRRCSCFKEIVKRMAAQELSSAAPLKLSSFDTFDLKLYPDRIDTDSGVNIRSKMSRNYTFCNDYAENFHLPCEGILMQGNTGLGKTHLSLAIAKTVIAKGFGVIYGSAPDLLRKIEKEHFSRWENSADGGNSGTADLLQSTDLLVFDDLGAEFDSRFYVSAFYNLLNSRINAGLPTVVNTNFELSQLKERYGDRIMSRLLTMQCLVFVGDDIRVGKKYGI
ncbi:MAG: ATP-binding protein [Oscillospiraceae bacterium]|nr:ATP-binding protein [Oscillospiraceae bacterium]